MTFSGALTLTDLDDFLAPSQACILPVKQTNKVPRAQQMGETDGDTEIHVDYQKGAVYEVQIGSTAPYSATPTAKSGDEGASGVDKVDAQAEGQRQGKELEKAEISLNDCLACSGCVTSTESLLITMQSHLEVQTYINSRTLSTPKSQDTNPTEFNLAGEGTSAAPTQPDTRSGILSISPQTLASLAASYFPDAFASTSSSSVSQSSASDPRTILKNHSLRTLLHRIRYFLKQPANGLWSEVWDTTFARHLSLMEHLKEFRERQAVARRATNGSSRTTANATAAAPGLPMLASACPGWVCYAEKAHGDLLGHVAATRSSQAISGVLAKQWWAERNGKCANEVYHVTVMPCYDKKLEASRQDFYNDQFKTRDVDCVLTTGELDLLLKERGFDPYAPAPDEDTLVDTTAPFPELIQHPGSTSGSYLQALMDDISARHPNPTRVSVRPVRNSDDHVEYFIHDTTNGEIIFKGSRCYGFRNLQNLVRKVGKETGIKSGRSAGSSKLSAAVAARRKAKKLQLQEGGAPSSEVSSDASSIAPIDEKSLDYVEVMACPGGCINGGGQMKPPAAEGKRDTEGFERPIQDDGVASKPQIDESMRWSTKEWVAKMETAYWAGLPTPPPSPGLVSQPQTRLTKVDEAARTILVEICKPAASEYSEEMDDAAESRRRNALRTQYHKVETDITSLASVKW